MPTGLSYIDAVVFGGSLDIGEGLFALLVGDIFDLIEAGDSVAYMGGVGQRLLAFVRKGVDRGGKIVALLCVEGLVVFVMPPCRFHGGLQSF